jgi:hypothetical protein
MNTTKIIELFIDEEYEEAGIEAISLVSNPAHEETWMAFNKDKCSCGSHKMEEQEIDEYSPYTIVEDDFCSHNPLLATLGEPNGTLEKDGWEIVRIEKITPQVIHKMNQQKFSDPNAPSDLDTDNYRVRFKYVGPRDSKNRRFCAEMLSFNRIYREEDISQLSNPEFGVYSIMLFRGSYNCRHTWVKLIYKKEGRIINSGSSQKGLEESEAQSVNAQPDTRPEATIRSADEGRGQNQWKPGMPRTGPNLFAEEKGLEDACWEGYEAIGTKILDGKEVPNCVPIKMTEDDFAESISDYPEGVKDAAARAVKWADENGWGSCGTQVGKTRASQLAKGEPISVDTLKRMYSYLSRHKVDLQSSKSYDDGCGKLMFDSWGGEAALTWSERKLKQLENMKMVFSVVDEDKKIIVGAAMVPNKMIHRYDSLGNLYYVFFSKESIKKMADKFLKEKRTDETSIEHNGLKLGSDKVYITESWVSEDEVYDKSSKYGFSLPAGTWFVSMKVNDDKVWKLIKEKALTGYSVEGLFAEKSVFSKEDKQINQIKQLLKSIKDYDK